MSDATEKWYGYAGHFVGGMSCAFHLTTRIPGYLISTVGHYIPKSEDHMRTIGSSEDDYFETYVLICDGEDADGNPNVLDWNAIDSERYAESLLAEKGHYEFLAKYRQKIPHAPSGG